MLSRPRSIFVPLPLLGFILAVFQVPGSQSLPLSVSAKEQAVSQTPAPADSSNETVYVIALGKDGRPITDLKAEEVRVIEDKVEQKVTTVSSAASEPLTIGFFFDISGSRHADRSIPDEAKLAGEFVRAIWHEGDTGFVLAFSDKVFAAMRATGNLEDIDNGLNKIPGGTYYGSTALYDALCTLDADRLNGMPGRKIYVVLSDFEDNSSKNRLKDVVKLAHAGKIAIFPVVLNEGFGGGYSKREEKRGKQTAQELADETGGAFLIPESPRELKAIFDWLTVATQATYRVSYASSSHTASSHKKNLRVETDRPQVRLLFAKN